MDVYRTEEEQIAAIKGWWQRNGVAVVVAALLAIGAYAGWTWYQHDRLERSLAAAALSVVLSRAHIGPSMTRVLAPEDQPLTSQKAPPRKTASAARTPFRAAVTGLA